jgi:hypothetical protein
VKRAAIALLLVAASLSAAGCASRQWISPTMAGTVVDGRTGAPLPGVEIRRSAWRSPAAPVGRSGADGSFRVDAERVTVFGIPFGDPIRTGSYSFRLDGYREGVRPFALFGGEVVRGAPPILADGTVRLERE